MSDIEVVSLFLCDSYKVVFGAGAPVCSPKQELGIEMKSNRRQWSIHIVVLSLIF
tara:strand:- start:975 stop:1139 length:165 start_codon:yes stop_codon:yes gene_type:complete